jgi:uncharacterized protein involved in copper resistance
MRFDAMFCAAALSLFAAQGALAFDAAAPDASTQAPAVKPHTAHDGGDAGARSARSIECSQKADAQNLHGKPRKYFMRDCKHGA